MNKLLVLPLFPGIGLLDMAFEKEGFCVVRGPDLLWGGDIHNFHPPMGCFSGVIGGPPCQAFSRMNNINCKKGYKVCNDNLIPEFERCLIEAKPNWFMMENVPEAPVPDVAEYTINSFVLNNRWVGGVQNRKRRISFGLWYGDDIDLRKFINVVALEQMDFGYAVCANGTAEPGMRKREPSRRGMHRMGYKTAKALQEALFLQGLPDDFLKEAPFTLAGKHHIIGNGVPIPMGLALARAIKEFINHNGN